MLPVKKEGSALTVYQEKSLAQKEMIINEPAVQAKLTSTEMMLAQAGTELPIRFIPDGDLIGKTATAAKFICRDVGIKTWDNTEIMKYDAVRFYTHLKNYFSDLTLKEVKMAFELAAVGELDEWLPKGRDGKADCEHYQSFSLQYYSKILKAYRAKKGQTWHKARKALPAPEITISEKERQENRRHCIQDIYDAFELYRTAGTLPTFQLDIFINIFIAQGLIAEKPALSDTAIESAYQRLIAAKPAGNIKKALIESFHSNKPDGLIKAEAQRHENNRAIAREFQRIIMKKKDIKLLIK